MIDTLINALFSGYINEQLQNNKLDFLIWTAFCFVSGYLSCVWFYRSTGRTNKQPVTNKHVRPLKRINNILQKRAQEKEEIRIARLSFVHEFNKLDDCEKLFLYNLYTREVIKLNSAIQGDLFPQALEVCQDLESMGYLTHEIIGSSYVFKLKDHYRNIISEHLDLFEELKNYSK